MGYLTDGDQNPAMDVISYLGPAIGQIRKRNKMTQASVAEAMGTGFGQTDLSRVENGKQGLSLESLAALAAALRVPVSDVWLEAEALAGGRLHQWPDETGDLAIDDPGKAAARVANDIDALRYALGAAFSVMGAMRPVEAEHVKKALRRSPQKFLDKRGSIHALIEALDAGARLAKAQAGAQPGAVLE